MKLKYAALIIEANGGQILYKTTWRRTLMDAESSAIANAKRYGNPADQKEVVIIDRARNAVKVFMTEGRAR